jgi:DNA helicase-2/ATP-dependent DNA helicase PcrA
MTNFDQAYTKLNPQQKLAVDTIDGPVMVLAGPGTGKTQLLSVRVANILDKTDSVPDNIMCLTFTDAAAAEMRARLVSLIGQAGYDVNVLTFHAFGSEIINRFPEYFYQGATMEAIDDVTRYAVLHDIFAKLPHSNPLSSKYEGDYTYLRDAMQSIGQLKKAAISPEGLQAKLEQQQSFVDQAEPLIAEIFGANRISKKMLPALENALEQLKKLPDTEPFFVASLAAALESGETPPVTVWKGRWMEKTKSGNFILKDRKRITKLMALVEVYAEYQKSLAEGRWYDYDDMIMNVVEELTSNDDLRAQIQEQYQYLLVDEFQDTNDAQLRLLRLLADNPANEGRPNILVVGDDDQAIYKFQGAEVTNMHQFASWVDSPTIVPLNDIYRYSDPLLELSKSVIEHAETRLSNQVEGINKQLRAVPEHDFEINRLSFEDEFAEYDNVAQMIADEISAGTSPNTIAVIARQHSHLEKFSQYAGAKSVPLEYERQDDVLDQPLVKELIHFANVVYAISKTDRETTNQLMPELLSYRFWGIEPKDLWRLNATVKNRRETWLDVMLDEENDNQQFSQIANYLLETAQMSVLDPLSATLDRMIGSPYGYFFNYYFRASASEIDAEYLRMLASLKTIREKVIQHSGEGSTIADMLEYIDLQKQAKIRLVSSSPVSQADNAVSLMSAHSAKGLEFEHVYILHAQDNVWGAARSGQGAKLSWTSNLNIAPAGEDSDDRVRLFYVALTRAKHKLTLSSARSFNNKVSMPLRLLSDDHPETQVETPASQLAEAFVLDWTSHHYQAAKADRAALNPYLEKYSLSITHLQNFVDVRKNGPTFWLIYNLLRFPGPSIPAAAYGSAIHATLSEAQKYLSAHEKPKAIDDLVEDFTASLRAMNMPASELKFYEDRGKLSLEKYLSEKYLDFKPQDKSEVEFYGDNVTIGDAKITGQADRINLIDGDWKVGKVEVVDFKTGKSSDSWKGKDDFSRIKLHQYRQQLLFYELLMKKSKRFKNLNVVNLRLEFVEPDQDEQIVSLDHQSTDDEIERLEQLIEAVWRRIQNKEIPDVSSYSQDISGIKQFEDDLIGSM